MSDKKLLLSTTMIPLLVLGAIAGGGMVLTGQIAAPPARAACSPCNPCAAAKTKNPCNPCAAASPCNPCAAANPCATANPCNPCAAANPCNPCAAANPCNPCSPCAAGSGGSVAACAVPRLQSAAAANPCAAAKPCAPCAAANPCNPCAAANPCNPCAAANPCNPCAAANPCNPCAAANPCNPCAAANPCNPCAAANPCNPCNPCAAGAAAELTDQEAVTAYDCLLPTMTAAYARSDRSDAAEYSDWRRYSTRAYVSATHGNRYVQNYGNAAAKGYGAYEDAGTFPPGATLGKDSFMVNGKGEVSVGPLFLMEKMEAGFNPDSDDWRYTMVMPNGAVFGTTKGQGSENVGFCIECHKAVTPAQDNVMLLPEEYRVK